MKKHWVIIISLFFLVSYRGMHAQTSITIGEGDTTTYDVPLNATSSASWSAALYLQQEINLSGTISHIAFLLENTVINSIRNNQKVFMMHTSDTSFTDGTKPDTSVMTKVFDGNMNWTGSGWYTLYLPTPFEYNNSDNLIIYWENLHGVFSFGNFPYFTSTITSNNSVKFASSSFASELPGDGENGNNRPNTRLTFDTDALFISSITLTQNERYLLPGDLNKPIINILIDVEGTEGAIYIDGFWLTTNGTTNLEDIDAISVYYTSNSNIFSSDVQFSTSVLPYETVLISDSQPLSTGNNNFWVAYDVNASAAAGNHLDAGCTAIYAGGQMYGLELSEPPGYREITLPIDDNITVGPGGSYEDLSSVINIINDIGLDNDLTIIISGSSTLTGSVSLNGWGSDNTFTMTVPSGSNTHATVTSESPIEFNDVNNLVLDGRDQLLTFINTSASSPVLNLNNVSTTTVSSVRFFGSNQTNTHTTTVSSVGLFGGNQTSIHSSGNYPGLIYASGDIHNLVITGCAIGGLPGAGNPAVGIVMGTQGQSFDVLQNAIVMNSINADQLGILVSPSAISTTVQSNGIYASEIVPYGWTGIYDYGLSTFIDGNTIILPKNIQNESSNFGIRQNRVILSKVYNNFIYGNVNNTSSPFSLLAIVNDLEELSDTVAYKFNTIYFTGTASGATIYGISADHIGHMDFSGNIVSNHISGTNEIGAISIQDTSISLNLDHNNYDLLTGTSIGTITYLTSTVSFSELAQWQSFSGQDANSTVGMVPYTTPGAPELTIPPGAELTDFSHLLVTRDTDVLTDITGEERNDPTFKGAFDPHLIANTIEYEVITPKAYALYQNYPNPFNPITSIKYDIAQRGRTVLLIYNVIGQKVKTVDLGYKEIGSYTYHLDMSTFASGLYFYQLKSGQISNIKKMLLLK
jgi:hypothetical protein